MPKFTNPADHYMPLMSRSEEVEEEAYVKRIEALADHQKQHAALIPVPWDGAPRFFSQFLILLARAWRCYIRDPRA